MSYYRINMFQLASRVVACVSYQSSEACIR
jgi:hypothetical protein